MTRPAWHGLRVGDHVRLRDTKRFLRVVEYARDGRVPAQLRVFTWALGDEEAVSFLTDIVEKRR